MALTPSLHVLMLFLQVFSVVSVNASTVLFLFKPSPVRKWVISGYLHNMQFMLSPLGETDSTNTRQSKGDQYKYRTSKGHLPCCWKMNSKLLTCFLSLNGYIQSILSLKVSVQSISARKGHLVWNFWIRPPPTFWPLSDEKKQQTETGIPKLQFTQSHTTNVPAASKNPHFADLWWNKTSVSSPGTRSHHLKIHCHFCTSSPAPQAQR